MLRWTFYLLIISDTWKSVRYLCPYLQGMIQKSFQLSVCSFQACYWLTTEQICPTLPRTHTHACAHTVRVMRSTENFKSDEPAYTQTLHINPVCLQSADIIIQEYVLHYHTICFFNLESFVYVKQTQHVSMINGKIFFPQIFYLAADSF